MYFIDMVKIPTLSIAVIVILELVSKVGDSTRERPKGSLFNSYYTEE